MQTRVHLLQASRASLNNPCKSSDWIIRIWDRLIECFSVNVSNAWKNMQAANTPWITLTSEQRCANILLTLHNTTCYSSITPWEVNQSRYNMTRHTCGELEAWTQCEHCVIMKSRIKVKWKTEAMSIGAHWCQFGCESRVLVKSWSGV